MFFEDDKKNVNKGSNNFTNREFSGQKASYNNSLFTDNNQNSSNNFFSNSSINNNPINDLNPGNLFGNPIDNSKQQPNFTKPEPNIGNINFAGSKNFPDFQSQTPEIPIFDSPIGQMPADSSTNNLIMDIPVTVQIVLGSTVLPVSNLMNLKRDSVINLDSALGESVDIVVNGRTIAKGELVPIDEDGTNFGVRLIELTTKS